MDTFDWFSMETEDGGGEVFHKDMRYIVAYDIVSNKKRLKLAHIITEYGDRIQKSVYEVFLNEKTYPELWERLIEHITDPDDRLRMYPLCRSCESKVEVAGGGPRRLEEVEVYIV